MIRTATLHWHTAASLTLTCLVMGCGESGEVDVTLIPMASVTTPVAIAAIPAPAADGSASPIVSTSLSGDESSTEAADAEPVARDIQPDAEQVVQYTPPFPDRAELFIPPKREGGMVLKDGGTEDAVELLGFVRLDKQQVVLSINGQLTRITEGDSQYGIEVISITPPEVVLQRGRQRWQASLEK